MIVLLLHAGWLHRRVNHLVIMGTTDALFGIAVAIGSNCSTLKQVEAAGSAASLVQAFIHCELTLGQKLVSNDRRNEDIYDWA